MTDGWASFDVYGTLVDWDGGTRATLARLWPDADAGELLERYHEVEPRAQLESAAPYRTVLADTLRLLAEHEGLPLAPGDEDALPEALPTWPAFPDVRPGLEELRRRGWRIAFLSNTDSDLLAASIAQIGVEPDTAVTVAEAASYKPAHGHWRRFLEREDVDRDRHVHVAASPFHDLAPCAELGIPAVWINRRGAESALPRAAELSSLDGLAAALDAVVAR